MRPREGGAEFGASTGEGVKRKQRVGQASQDGERKKPRLPRNSPFLGDLRPSSRIPSGLDLEQVDLYHDGLPCRSAGIPRERRERLHTA